MEMASFGQHFYRAAVALNNIGVSLVMKGFSQEAIKVFTDAVLVMRAQSEFAKEQCFALESIRSSSTMVESMLQKANKALCNSQRVALDDIDEDYRPTAPSRICQLVYYSSCTFAAVNENVMSSDNDQSFFIHIDFVDNQDYEEGTSQRSNLATAVILYNFANCQLFVPLITPSTAERYDFAKRALLLHMLAHDMILCIEESNSECYESYFHLLPFSILLLRTISQVSLIFGLPIDDSINEKLVKLQQGHLADEILITISQAAAAPVA